MPAFGGTWVITEGSDKLVPLSEGMLPSDIKEYFPDKGIYEGEVIEVRIELRLFNN